MAIFRQYLDDMIITGNFNHDYHDNQNIAHPYAIVFIFTLKKPLKLRVRLPGAHESIRYSENDCIMSTLEALKKFVGKEPESVTIKTGTLDCSYCQFTGGGDIHICNINNPTTLPITK